MSELFTQKNAEVGKNQTPTNLMIEPKTTQGVIHKKAIHVPSGSHAEVVKKLNGGNVKKS